MWKKSLGDGSKDAAAVALATVRSVLLKGSLQKQEPGEAGNRRVCCVKCLVQVLGVKPGSCAVQICKQRFKLWCESDLVVF